MPIQDLYNAKVFEGTQAEFDASNIIFKKNDLLVTSDTNILKKGNNIDKYVDLMPIGEGAPPHNPTLQQVLTAGNQSTIPVKLTQITSGVARDVDGMYMYSGAGQEANIEAVTDGVAHSRIVISQESLLIEHASGSNIGLTAEDEGNSGVQINKRVTVQPAVLPVEATTLEQVTSMLAITRTSGDVSLQLDGEDLIWPVDVATGKIRLYNATPGSDNSFYGFGVVAQTFVYQVTQGASHVFYTVDGSDNQVELFRIAGTGDITATADLHMSEKKIVNIADGSNARDAVNFQQLGAKLTATQGAAQADSTATTIAGLVSDFNALLTNLRTAGIIATTT